MATAKTSTPLSSLTKPLGAFLRRFHLLFFFVVIVGCLAAAVVLINKTLAEGEDAQYTSSIGAGSIDQATLERIQSLHTSDQPTPAQAPPSGRSNPFAE